MLQCPSGHIPVTLVSFVLPALYQRLAAVAAARLSVCLPIPLSVRRCVVRLYDVSELVTSRSFFAVRDLRRRDIYFARTAAEVP